MRKLTTILTLLCALTVTTVRAQRVNIDTKTTAAMASAYSAETVAETYYKSNIKDILDHYTTAEVAAAGIFTSKYLDRKALTDLGILTDQAQNHYYRRIYSLVSAKIMPKIWTVSKMMLKHPHAALYWGSYIMKVCAEVKTLCMQFEQVVTNSTLTFKGIPFLELNKDIAALVNLADLGSVDWKTFFDGFADNVQGRLTKESLQQDLDHLYDMGAALATAGVTNLLGGSTLNDIIQGKLPTLVNTAKSAHTFVETLDDGIGPALLRLVGGPDSVANLFTLSSYTLTDWQSPAAQDHDHQYYTQRWYIYRIDSGSETLADYEPPTDDYSIKHSPQWYTIKTTNPTYKPTAVQLEAIMQNSEKHAGITRSRVKYLTAQAPQGHTYELTTRLYTRTLTKDRGNQYAKAFAYAITATHSWNLTEQVYEEVFDSYAMDLTTFMNLLNARLSEYNDNEDGHTYKIASDPKKPYQAPDTQKLEGCEEALISVTCTGQATLGQGTAQYKCSRCSGTLDTHTRQCVMATTVTESPLDTSELDQKEADAQHTIDQLQQQITQLETQNKDLLKRISTSSVEDAAKLRQQYTANQSQIDQLNADLVTAQSTLADIRQAKADAAQDNAVATDDHYRIPAIMQDCKTAYTLTWQSAGTWDSWTYQRQATMPNIKGTVLFKATPTIARKPKYFLGIKIHRAIISIAWSLTAQYTDTQVVKAVELDPDADPKTKEQAVTQAISSVAQSYPDCTITTEYLKSSPTPTDDTPDTHHLLWASDRLEIARQVETRLSHIYADLVSLEKMMHYKLNIVDLWKKYTPYTDDQAGRRSNLLQQAHHRWLTNAHLTNQPHIQAP